MAKAINCECGFVARGATDDEVVEVDPRAYEPRSSRSARLGSTDSEISTSWIEEI